MKSKKMSAWLLALCLGVPFLAACGGGGGGGGSAQPTVNGSVSATDYEVVANGVVDTLTATNAASSALAGSYSVGGASQPSNDAIVSLVRQGVARLRAGERAQPLAIASETVACSSGGSLAVTVSYKDPNTVSAGDYVDFQAQSCVEGGVRLDGGMRLTVTSVTQQSFAAQLVHETSPSPPTR